MMLPLLCLLLLFSTMPVISNGLNLKLILPGSPESPFYVANLSYWERTHRIAKQSNSRALYLSSRALAYSRNNVRPPIYPGDGLYAVKLGIGTFTGKSTAMYKSYLLAMDTGSDEIWLQCDDCWKNNKCFTQKGEPPFPCHLSQTCQPIQCNDFLHSCDNPGEYCDGEYCHYDIWYADDTHSTGFLAHETFTFDGSSREEHQIVEGIRFGCGVYQENVSFAQDNPDNQIAGIVGLSWSPTALHTQLDPQSDSKFSYCLPPYDSINQEAYLNFGADIEPITPEFQSTSLMIAHGLYWVFLNDISINCTRLNIPLGDSFRNSYDGSKASMVDSGTSVTMLLQPAYDAVVNNLVELFSRDPNLIRKQDDFMLCYDRKQPQSDLYAGLPNITFHLQEADFDVGPEGAFHVEEEDGTQYFCLYMQPTDTDSIIIGNYQQINHRIIYDPKRNILLFKSEQC